jgi:mannose-6-phosphate isomerase-like protein (cupin superfamily)
VRQRVSQHWRACTPKAAMSKPCLDNRVILSSARANRHWRSMSHSVRRPSHHEMTDFCYIPKFYVGPTVREQTARREPGMTQTNQVTALRVRRASEIEATGGPAAGVDRYLVESRDSNGMVALVEQILPPRGLAAPLHRHSREDEYSVVLEGRLGVFQDGEEVVATPGDIVFKPRGHWHTFWNAGDGQLRILELIAPAGLEELFRRLAEPGGEYDPSTLPALAAQYGCEVDFEATMPLVERHNLVF